MNQVGIERDISFLFKNTGSEIFKYAMDKNMKIFHRSSTLLKGFCSSLKNVGLVKKGIYITFTGGNCIMF